MVWKYIPSPNCFGKRLKGLQNWMWLWQLKTGVGGNEPVLCESGEELLLAGASLYWQ